MNAPAAVLLLAVVGIVILGAGLRRGFRELDKLEREGMQE